MPLGLGVVSSASGAATPAVALSCATVVAAGSNVAVWKPSMAKPMVVPWATVSARGKKSSKPQLWYAGHGGRLVGLDDEHRR